MKDIIADPVSHYIMITEGRSYALTYDSPTGIPIPHLTMTKR